MTKTEWLISHFHSCIWQMFYLTCIAFKLCLISFSFSLPVTQTEEHNACNAKVMGLIPRESMNWLNVYVICFICPMHKCKSDHAFPGSRTHYLNVANAMLFCLRNVSDHWCRVCLCSGRGSETQRHRHDPEGPDEDAEDDHHHRPVVRGLLDALLFAGHLVLVPAGDAEGHARVHPSPALRVRESEHLLWPGDLRSLHALVPHRSRPLLPLPDARTLATLSGPALGPTRRTRVWPGQR